MSLFLISSETYTHNYILLFTPSHHVIMVLKDSKVRGFPVHSHKLHSDKWEKNTDALQVKSVNCSSENAESFLNQVGELFKLSNPNNAHLIGISKKYEPQVTDRELGISVISLFRMGWKIRMGSGFPCTYVPPWLHIACALLLCLLRWLNSSSCPAEVAYWKLIIGSHHNSQVLKELARLICLEHSNFLKADLAVLRSNYEARFTWKCEVSSSVQKQSDNTMLILYLLKQRIFSWQTPNNRKSDQTELKLLANHKGRKFEWCDMSPSNNNSEQE